MNKIWKNIKKLLIAIIILPMVVVFPYGCSCNENDVDNTSSNSNNSYTVHFYTGTEDTFNIPNQIVNKGGLVRKPETPIRSGWDFIGWCKDMQCTVYWTFEIETVHSDMTLYAHWVKR